MITFVVKFLKEGGIFMWPILGCSLIGFAFVLERWYMFSMAYAYREQFFRDVISFLRRGEVDAARNFCHRTSHPLAKVMSAALHSPGLTKDSMESAAGIALQKVIPRIQKRTGYIQMIANISTLIGLLGTIQGLIMAFMSLENADAASKAALLAKGISTAMNTTAFGLFVAIPCIVAYTVLSNKEMAILQKYGETVSEVIHICSFELRRNRDQEQGKHGAA